MAVPFVKVFYTGTDGVEQDITEFTNLQDKRGLQIKDAKSDIAVNNSKYRYKVGGESQFIADGTVEIYADYNPIAKTTAQLVLSGQIQEIGHTFGERGSETKLSVSDKTTLLLGSLWSKDYVGAAANKVDELVKNVVLNAPSASGQVTTNNVTSLNASSSAFPIVEMSKVMKPIYEWLTDLSQPGVTGDDKAYLFYVDKQNDLHWFYPTNSVSNSVLEGSDELYSVNLKKSQDELVNMIIYNAGQDLYGNGNMWYTFDATSKSNKLRMKYQPMIDVGRDLFKGELPNIVEDASGAFHYQGKSYSISGSYPKTPRWDGASPVNSDGEYNSAFRERQRLIAKDKAQAIMKAFSGLRWNGSVELKGNANYVAGNLVSVQLPTIGIPIYNLRVWDVQHSFGSDGWVTTLQLREDDEAIRNV